MKKYAFSQSLDNTSPDIFLEEENVLSPDSPLRKNIANTIFDVSKDGKVVLSEQSGIKIYKFLKSNNLKYVANLPTNELDIAGRKTFITLLLEFDNSDLEKSKEIEISLKEYTEHVLKTCKKTVEESFLQIMVKHLMNDLERNKKKIFFNSSFVKILVVIIFVIVLVFLIYFLGGK